MFPLYLLLLFAFGLLQRLIMSLLFLGKITLVSIGQQGRGEGIFNSANEKGEHNWLHLSPVEGLDCFHVFQEVLFWPHAKQLPFNKKFTLGEMMKLQESDQQAQKSAKILLVARNSMCSERVHKFRVVCADSSPKKASGCFSGARCWQSDPEGHIRSAQWKTKIPLWCCVRAWMSTSNMKVGSVWHWRWCLLWLPQTIGRWSELHMPVVFLNLQLNTAKLKLGAVFLQVELLIEIKIKRRH